MPWRNKIHQWWTNHNSAKIKYSNRGSFRNRIINYDYHNYSTIKLPKDYVFIFLRSSKVFIYHKNMSIILYSFSFPVTSSYFLHLSVFSKVFLPSNTHDRIWKWKKILSAYLSVSMFNVRPSNTLDWNWKWKFKFHRRIWVNSLNHFLESCK